MAEKLESNLRGSRRILRLMTESPAKTSLRRLGRRPHALGRRKVPKEDSVAEKEFGGAPCEDEMKEGRQETITSFMTSTLGRPLNLLRRNLSEQKIQHTKQYTKHRP